MLLFEGDGQFLERLPIGVELAVFEHRLVSLGRQEPGVLHPRRADQANVMLRALRFSRAPKAPLSRSRKRFKLGGDPPWGGNKRVIFVDDEESIRRLAKLQLRSLGYRIVACRDAEEALQVLEHEAFDLVITDHFLPALSGEELALRFLRVHPELPVLLTTGGALRVDSRSLELEVLEKPYDQASLARKILRAFSVGPPLGKAPNSAKPEGVGEMGLEPTTRSTQSYASTN